MIAVDSSAVLAIVQGETSALACLEVLRGEDTFVMSAATLAECLIVSNLRGRREVTTKLLNGLSVTMVEVNMATAERVSDIYAKWGKGVHPAGLNYGDCFAYDVAKQHGCPLLFVGDDFTKTDIESAL